MAGKITRFFLNGNLHRVLHTNRAQDKLTAYDYIEGKVKIYPWSEVKKKSQRALTVTEAAELIGRHRDRIMRWIYGGEIAEPQREYSLENGAPGRYFFSEDDMMELHDFMSSIHHGRPRKDGRVTNNRLPPKEELRAMIQTNQILYVKRDDEFIPIWTASEW